MSFKMLSEPPENPYHGNSGPHDVTFLPVAISQNNPVYPGEAHQFPKLLRAEGVDADFLHENPAERAWREHMGETTIYFVIALGLNILGSGGWDAFKLAWTKWIRPITDGSNLSVDFAWNSRSGERLWFRAEGSGEEVIEAMSRARDFVRSNDDEAT